MSSFLDLDLATIILRFARFADSVNLLHVSQLYYHDRSLWYLLLCIRKTEGPLFGYPGQDLRSLDIIDLRNIASCTRHLWHNLSRPTAPLKSHTTLNLPPGETLFMLIPGHSIALAANFLVDTTSTSFYQDTHGTREGYLRCYDLRSGSGLGEPVRLQETIIPSSIVSNIWLRPEECILALVIFDPIQPDHDATLVVLSFNLEQSALRIMFKISLGKALSVPFTMRPWIHDNAIFVVEHCLDNNADPRIIVKMLDLKDKRMTSCTFTSPAFAPYPTLETMYVHNHHLHLIFRTTGGRRTTLSSTTLDRRRFTPSQPQVDATPVIWHTPNHVVFSSLASGDEFPLAIFRGVTTNPPGPLFSFRTLRIENDQLIPDTAVPAIGTNGLRLAQRRLVAPASTVGALSGRSLIYFEDYLGNDREHSVRAATLVAFHGDETPIQCELELPPEAEEISTSVFQAGSVLFDENLGLMVFPPFTGITSSPITRVPVLWYV